MDMYSFGKIREAGDCVDYCKTVLGMKEQGRPSDGWHKFNNPWRPGSDSGAFSVCKTGFNDFVSQEKGSIIDLCPKAEVNGDMWQAQKKLGEYYRLKVDQVVKPAKTRQEEDLGEIEKVYDYIDASGTVRHRTVRFERNKTAGKCPFRQWQPDGKGGWTHNIKGVETILYRLQSNWSEGSTVFLCEGEKDADNVADLDFGATTVPMGAGKWNDSYTPYFKDKHVIILFDHDDAGRHHSAMVQWKLKGVAKSLRAICLFDQKPGGDASDWIEAGGTKDQLIEICKAEPEIDQDKITEPKKEVDSKTLSDAKLANQKAFKNFEYIRKDTPGGSKLEPVSLRIDDLVQDIYRRFWDFPRRIGSMLFDLDRKTGKIRYLPNPTSLFAWISQKSGHQVNWMSKNDAAKKEELFEVVHATARHYESISNVPSWPERSDVFYTHTALPKPSRGARYFNEFCRFFTPATEVDSQMIRAFVASPLYYNPSISRPLWVIDSIHGQGTGKTKLVEMVAKLYGGMDLESGEVIKVFPKQLKGEGSERIFRRVLSTAGRKKRIFLLDNVEGRFKSPELADLVTASSISGLAPYGKTEETRPNDLTYVITANTATLDRDLVSRSFFINVAKPGYYPEWEERVLAYIHAHQLQIIADMISLLEAGSQFEFKPITRFANWEKSVLAPMVGSLENFNDIWKSNEDRKEASDSDREEAEQVREYYKEAMRALGLDPDTACIFIHSQLAAFWLSEILPQYKNRSSMYRIRNFAKTGMIPELSDRWKAYPHNSADRKRGIIWNYEYQKNGVNIVGLSREKNPVLVFQSPYFDDSTAEPDF